MGDGFFYVILGCMGMGVVAALCFAKVLRDALGSDEPDTSATERRGGRL